MALCDATGCLLEVNPALVAMLGAPDAAALRGLDCLRSEAMRRFGLADRLATCLAGGGVERFEVRDTTSWGRTVHLEVRLAAVRDGAGAVTGALAILEDVAARCLDERALARRDQILRLLADTAGRLLTVEDLGAVVPGIVRDLGAACGASTAVLFVVDPSGPGRPRLRTVEREGVEGTAEAAVLLDGWERVGVRLAAGEAVVAPVQGLPLRTAADAPLPADGAAVVVPIHRGASWWGGLVLGRTGAESRWGPAEVDALRACADIVGSAVERLAGEREQRRTREMLEAAFAGMESGVLVTDAAECLLAANPAALTLLECDGRVDWRGRRLAEFAPGAEAMLRPGSPGERGEARWNRPSGRPVQVGFASGSGPADGPRVTLFRDLEPILEAEARRRRSEQLAQVGEMAARLSHEMKNPLAAMLAGLELLEREAVLSAPHRRLVRSLGEEVRRQARALNDLLGSARPSQPRVEPQPLDPLLAGVAERYAALGRARGFALSVTSGGADDPVAVDPDGFRRLLENLLNNAVDAVGRGGRIVLGRRRLDAAERRRRFPGFDGGVVGVFVRDDGHGIAEADLPRLFEPFHTTKATGTGLGLPVALQLVKDHGGVLEVLSTPGRGSRFEVFLASGAERPCWGDPLRPAECRDCEGCEVHTDGTGHGCWVTRGRGTEAATGRWHEDCRRCGVFRDRVLQAHCARLITSGRLDRDAGGTGEGDAGEHPDR